MFNLYGNIKGVSGNNKQNEEFLEMSVQAAFDTYDRMSTDTESMRD